MERESRLAGPRCYFIGRYESGAVCLQSVPAECYWHPASSSPCYTNAVTSVPQGAESLGFIQHNVLDIYWGLLATCHCPLFIYLYKFIYFIYLLLAALGPRCCARAFLQLRQAGATLRCGARASHCSGLSCRRARALGRWASVVLVRGLSSCGSQALEHRLSSCGAWAQLLHGMWNLPRPGLEHVSPALAGEFLTTAPPGKPHCPLF